MNQPTIRPSEQRHRGPSLLILSIVFGGLFIGSLGAFAALAHGGHFPSPFEPVDASNAFFATHGQALRAQAFLQFGASIPLAIYAATASSRLRFLGIEAAGTFIALVGGTLASTMTAFSALTQWALAQPNLEGTRSLHLLSFATGGPGFVAPFGLLIAGVALTAGLSRKLPRWVMWCGLAIAIVAELSSLSIAFDPAMLLLPIARFTGIVWLVVVGKLLPSTRLAERSHSTNPERIS